MDKENGAVPELSYALLQKCVLNFVEPMDAYEALLQAMGFQDVRKRLNGPNYLLTLLAAFESAYRDVLGVDYLYIVRSSEDDPVSRLRDNAVKSGKIPSESWPGDHELQQGLLLLLVTGFVYDFPLARRYCHAPLDSRKRQTRIAGWGAAYFEARLAQNLPFKELFQFCESAFRENLRSIAAFVVKESRMVDRPRLNDVIEWVAP